MPKGNLEVSSIKRSRGNESANLTLFFYNRLPEKPTYRAYDVDYPHKWSLH
jgi:hypothetical protein